MLLGRGSLSNLSASFEDIVFEVAVLDPPVGESHDTSTVIDAFAPLSTVDAAIGPVHFSVALALIADVVSIIDVA